MGWDIGGFDMKDSDKYMHVKRALNKSKDFSLIYSCTSVAQV